MAALVSAPDAGALLASPPPRSMTPPTFYSSLSGFSGPASASRTTSGSTANAQQTPAGKDNTASNAPPSTSSSGSSAPSTSQGITTFEESLAAPRAIPSAASRPRFAGVPHLGASAGSASSTSSASALGYGHPPQYGKMAADDAYALVGGPAALASPRGSHIHYDLDSPQAPAFSYAHQSAAPHYQHYPPPPPHQAAYTSLDASVSYVMSPPPFETVVQQQQQHHHHHIPRGSALSQSLNSSTNSYSGMPQPSHEFDALGEWIAESDAANAAGVLEAAPGVQALPPAPSPPPPRAQPPRMHAPTPVAAPQQSYVFYTGSAGPQSPQGPNSPQAASPRRVPAPSASPPPPATSYRPASAGPSASSRPPSDTMPCPMANCPWRSASNDAWREHVSAHGGQRPFACDVRACTRAFDEHADFVTHWLAHDKQQRQERIHQQISGGAQPLSRSVKRKQSTLLASEYVEDWQGGVPTTPPPISQRHGQHAPQSVPAGRAFAPMQRIQQSIQQPHEMSLAESVHPSGITRAYVYDDQQHPMSAPPNERHWAGNFPPAYVQYGSTDAVPALHPQQLLASPTIRGVGMPPEGVVEPASVTASPYGQMVQVADLDHQQLMYGTAPPSQLQAPALHRAGSSERQDRFDAPIMRRTPTLDEVMNERSGRSPPQDEVRPSTAASASSASRRRIAPARGQRARLAGSLSPTSASQQTSRSPLGTSQLEYRMSGPTVLSPQDLQMTPSSPYLGSSIASTSAMSISTSSAVPRDPMRASKRRKPVEAYPQDDPMAISTNTVNMGASTSSDVSMRTSTARSEMRASARNRKERTHKCLVGGCGKTFKRLEHLRRHARTHTNEKPYKCDLCDREFSRSDNLSQHRKTHFKEQGRNSLLQHGSMRWEEDGLSPPLEGVREEDYDDEALSPAGSYATARQHYDDDDRYDSPPLSGTRQAFHY